MELASYIALSRLSALQRSTEVAAHNLANANTPGFKPERMRFADYLMKDETRTGSELTRPRSDRKVRFVQDLSAYRDFSQGQINATGNAFDLAIGGEGFFAIRSEAGERFTRNGRFALDNQGFLVTQDGNQVLNADGQPIQIPPNATNVQVTSDGQVSTSEGPLGRLRVVVFENPQTLNGEGGNRFVASADDPGRQDEQPRIMQGAVEEANFDSILEVTKMMADLREFQFASQMVEREGERLTSAIDRLTRKRS